MQPGVQADQRLHSTLADMGSRTVGKTKSQLLLEINAMLNSFHAARVQLRSAPAQVRSSLKWDVLAEGKFKTAVGNTTTKGQIRAATKNVDGSHTEEGPFFTYILTPPCATSTPFGLFCGSVAFCELATLTCLRTPGRWGTSGKTPLGNLLVLERGTACPMPDISSR